MPNQGTMGEIEVFEHFMCFNADTGAAAQTTAHAVGSEGVMAVCVNEGVYSQVIDEPGGVLQILLDSEDNDNHAFYIGPFKPSDGGVVFETRFKISDITQLAVYAGFQETLDATTPVMPAEFATESFAYNASIGGFAGLQFDPDGTTDDWRAVAGDNAVAEWDADSDATRAKNAPVNDKFDVVRVELDPDRNTRIYLGQDTGTLKLVKKSTSAVMADSCLVHAVLMVEARAADTDLTLEVDYMYAKGYIDWTR